MTSSQAVVSVSKDVPEHQIEYLICVTDDEGFMHPLASGVHDCNNETHDAFLRRVTAEHSGSDRSGFKFFQLTRFVQIEMKSVGGASLQLNSTGVRDIAEFMFV